MKSIAVFGSAFNPPTLGHKSVIESLSHFDQVLLVPSIAHAWGKTMADYEVRCALVDAFIHDLHLPNVALSRIEETIFAQGEPEKPVTTFTLLSSLESADPNGQFTFVIGPDNFLKFSQFDRAEDILHRWSILACPEKVAVRSTDIREQMANSEDCAHLTTPLVWNYLQQAALY